MKNRAYLNKLLILIINNMAKLSRKTKQKEIILEELGSFRSFFTAEELHEKAKKKDNRLGIATVYRFLKEFKHQEELHSYSCDRKTIYSKGKNNHSHFICEKCGTISHLDLKSLDFFKGKINGEICHFQLDVYGTCKSCVKK